MAVKERIPTMFQFPCICGNNKKLVVGTVKHNVNGQSINIHNIPHYECTSCGKIEYNIREVKVTPLLKYAIKSGLSEVDYIDFHNMDKHL
jgi:YgiT-type zinc finger domain-containing protein